MESLADGSEAGSHFARARRSLGLSCPRALPSTSHVARRAPGAPVRVRAERVGRWGRRRGARPRAWVIIGGIHSLTKFNRLYSLIIAAFRQVETKPALKIITRVRAGANVYGVTMKPSRH